MLEPVVGADADRRRRMIDENQDDWDECESPRGMSGLDAGADVLAAFLVAVALGWIVYAFGL